MKLLTTPRADAAATSVSPPPRTWLNRNIVCMGLTSLLSVYSVRKFFSSCSERYRFGWTAAQINSKVTTTGGYPLGMREAVARARESRRRLMSAEGRGIASNRVLKKWCSCFDTLSTNGQCPTFSRPPPFALSLSKGERRVFQQPFSWRLIQAVGAPFLRG